MNEQSAAVTRTRTAFLLKCPGWPKQFEICTLRRSYGRVNQSQLDSFSPPGTSSLGPIRTPVASEHCFRRVIIPEAILILIKAISVSPSKQHVEAQFRRQKEYVNRLRICVLVCRNCRHSEEKRVLVGEEGGRGGSDASRTLPVIESLVPRCAVSWTTCRSVGSLSRHPSCCIVLCFRRGVSQWLDNLAACVPDKMHA